jgi:hypothetical protein
MIRGSSTSNTIDVRRWCVIRPPRRSAPRVSPEPEYRLSSFTSLRRTPRRPDLATWWSAKAVCNESQTTLGVRNQLACSGERTSGLFSYAMQRGEVTQFLDDRHAVRIVSAYKGEGKSALLRLAEQS